MYTSFMYVFSVLICIYIHFLWGGKGGHGNGWGGLSGCNMSHFHEPSPFFLGGGSKIAGIGEMGPAKIR